MDKINFPTPQYNRPLTIMLDLDGVCSNFSESACKIAKIDANDDKVRNTLKASSHALYELDKDIEKKIEMAGANFWSNLNLFPWAKSLYNTLQQYAEVVFLTSSGVFSQSYYAKKKWVEKHFNTEKIIFTRQKYYLAAPWAYLIDDYEKNVNLFLQNGGNAALWPNQYAIIDEHYNIDIIVQEIIDDIKRIKAKNCN